MVVRGLFVLCALAALLEGGSGSRSAALDDLITSALESFRKNLVSGWPEVELPPLEPVEFSSNNLQLIMEDVSMNEQLTSLTATGMSRFTTDVVESDVLLLRTSIELGLPLLDVMGTTNSLGGFSIQLHDISIGIVMSFVMSEEERTLEVDTMQLALYQSDTEGLLEDNVKGEVALLEVLELSYKPYLMKALKYEIDMALQGDGIGNVDSDDPIDDYFDRLLADIRQLILQDNMDPLHLPADSDDFDVTLYNTTLNGTVTVDQGMLKGLSTIHRAGNMSVRFVGIKAEVIWEGEIGLDDLEVDCTFGLDLPIFGKDLSLSLKMSYVHLSFETDVFLVRQNITLARCNITELGPLHYKEKGAGPLDTTLYDLLANTFLGSLHKLVMEISEQAICSLLENVISHV